MAPEIPAPQIPLEHTRTFASRWSEALAEDGFTQISNFFLRNYHRLEPEPLTHGEAMFVVHLMQHKWDSDAPFPKYETIAKRMGVTPKSVRRYAKSLQDKGFLRRERRRGTTNRFHLGGLIQALIALKQKLATLETG
ncbi:MAG: helix-turn-helix domain-containing protein [Verrucomicrobiales bacterium]